MSVWIKAAGVAASGGLIVLATGCGQGIAGHDASISPAVSPGPVSTRSLMPLSSNITPPTPCCTDQSLAYRTDVNPGSAIQFVDSSTGWLLADQGSTSHIGDGLISGPFEDAFPGTAIEATSDGGATWSPIMTDTSGIWGFDLLNNRVGWIVRVSSFIGTTDGGETTHPLSDTKPYPLVSVSFTTASNGEGLSTKGELYQTADGGASWQRVTTPEAFTGLCLTGKSGYAAAPNGDFYVSDDAGQNWQVAEKALVPGGGVWNQIDCNSGGGALLQEGLPAGIGQSPQYAAVISVSASGARVVAAQSTGAIPDGTPAPVTHPLWLTQTQSSTFLAGGSDQSGLVIFRSPHDTTFTKSSTPALPSGIDGGPAPGRVRVLGCSFVDSHGWCYLYDEALTTNGSPAYQSSVLASQDSGQTWSIASRGPVTEAGS